MAERKLITPRFRITVGDQVFTQGIRVECHSSRREQCSWATLEYDPGYAGLLDLASMAPAQVELGYDGDYDTALNRIHGGRPGIGALPDTGRYTVPETDLRKGDLPGLLSAGYHPVRPWKGRDCGLPPVRYHVPQKGCGPGPAHECGGAYPGGGPGLGSGGILLFPVRPVFLGDRGKSRRLSMYWRKGRTSFPSTNGTAVTKSRPSGSRGFTRESVSG
mgnify:CR=1 FL=1